VSDHPVIPTRDPRLELLRGALLVLQLSPGLMELPAIGWTVVLPAGAWTALSRLRLLDGLFVLCLAVVAGSVFGRTARTQGLARCAGALWQRALNFYLGFAGLALVVLLLQQVAGIKTQALTRWTDPASGLVGSIYPGAAERMPYQLFEVIFLRAGPGQLQLLALCAALLAFAPLLAWALQRNHEKAVLASSVALVGSAIFYNAGSSATGLSWLGAQFEQRYALLAWQLLFTFGFTFGWHRAQWVAWAARNHWTRLAGALACLCATMLSWIALAYCIQGGAIAAPLSAGLEAVLLLCMGGPLLMACYYLVAWAWKPLRRLLGFILLPLGQQPLAVFVLHGLWLMVFLQLPTLQPQTAAAALAVSWLITGLIVRSRTALRWLPH
jgi:hypothetical protein